MNFEQDPSSDISFVAQSSFAVSFSAIAIIFNFYQLISDYLLATPSQRDPRSFCLHHTLTLSAICFGACHVLHLSVSGFFARLVDSFLSEFALFCLGLLPVLLLLRRFLDESPVWPFHEPQPQLEIQQSQPLRQQLIRAQPDIDPIRHEPSTCSFVTFIQVILIMALLGALILTTLLQSIHNSLRVHTVTHASQLCGWLSVQAILFVHVRRLHVKANEIPEENLVVNELVARALPRHLLFALYSHQLYIYTRRIYMFLALCIMPLVFHLYSTLTCFNSSAPFYEAGPQPFRMDPNLILFVLVMLGLTGWAWRSASEAGRGNGIGDENGENSEVIARGKRLGSWCAKLCVVQRAENGEGEEEGEDKPDERVLSVNV